jgi:hypothetical protein
MNCCGPNRRLLLAALAASPLMVTSGTARAQPNSMIATDLELVTVTPTSAILTWTTLGADASGNRIPVDADTQVRLGPADATGPIRTVHEDTGRTPYHYAEVTGLEPGREYRFEAWSDGVRAVPAANVVTGTPGTAERTGVFTTLVPPPGRLRRTVALSNDVHFGEEVAGLIANGYPPGVRQEPGCRRIPR